ncbi:MAG: Gfo/Idh/MocA family oxidoreductase [Pirellulales bacterium]|nr:Gfo/Idh/MocA family oxidoreductase [Pirellulales bacterium]
MSSPADSSAHRRDFLKTSSVAAAAVAAGSLSIARSAHAAGADQIKIGLIGCGGRGTGAASQALHTAGDVKLVAMGDAFADRLESSLNELNKDEALKGRIEVPQDRRFTGFDAYKQVLDSGVDLVVLATPPGFRPIHFAAAIDAGKHVFMEKPVAVDAPGVRAVLEATRKAKEKNLGVGVGLQRHHQNSYIETIKRLQDGAIGDMVAARVYWNGAGLWVHPRKPEQTEMEYQMRNWYYFNWLCGDHIVEQHIHNMDVINWLKGKYPVRAQGMGGRQVRTGADFGEIYDHHAVEFEYDDGSRMFSYCRHIPGCWDSVTEHVHGTKGTADISAGVIKTKDEKPWRYRGEGHNPYQTEHDDLFASIRAGAPLNEGEMGAMSTMTAILGRMCTYSGKMLRWEDALNSQISLAPAEYAFNASPPVPAVAVPGQTKVV